MAKVVRNEGQAYVPAIEERPETFDIIGLTREQLALLVIITGTTAGDTKGSYSLYASLKDAIQADNDVVSAIQRGTTGVRHNGSPIPKVEPRQVNMAHVNHLLANPAVE